MGNENTNTFPEWRLSTDLEYQRDKEKMIDSTGLTKELYDQHRLEVYKRLYAHDPLKVSSTSEQQFPTATGDPWITQETKDWFGETAKATAQTLSVPTAIIGAKYFEGKAKGGYEYLSSQASKAKDYISATTKMPKNEIAHFLSSDEASKFVNQLTQFEDKIAALDPKVKDDLVKINKLKKMHTKKLAEGAKILTGKGKQTLLTSGLKILKGDELKYYMGAKTFLESYKNKGYSVDEKTMRNILKNHKNWSLFKLKGDMAKDWPTAVKNFFKKGTMVTKFGQDIVGFRVGQGIGDAIYEFEAPWVEIGKDWGTGIAGYKILPKVIKQVPKMIGNLSSKVKNFVMDGKTQKVVNQILKKRGAQTVAAGTTALGSGPFAAAIEPIIGLVGLGLTVNDIRKLFIGAEKDVAKLGIPIEDALDKNVEDVLKKTQFPKIATLIEEIDSLKGEVERYERESHRRNDKK